MSPGRQHVDLPAERWARFSFAQQVLMIGNEMNRGLYLLDTNQFDAVHGSYERVLNLVDLSVGLPVTGSRRRELLRWRDLIAALYLEHTPSVGAHIEAFRCLLRLTPDSSRQIAELPALADRPGSGPGRAFR